MSAPDKGIPQDLLDKAHCIVIVPGLKQGAFIVGGKYGRGSVSCRAGEGHGWSAPGAVRVEGGSLGFQIGASETDVILLVRNASGAKKLLSSQFTLGGEGEVAAACRPLRNGSDRCADAGGDPVLVEKPGRVSGHLPQGATLRQDLDVNQVLYGKRIENRVIVKPGVAPPSAASSLLKVLNKYSSVEAKG